LAASFFDFEHPLPAVYALSSFICLLLSDHFSYNLRLIFLIGSPVPCFSPSSSRGRTHSKCSCLCCV
jgi:hypothetical protein